MELTDLDLSKIYSYADYYKWKFEERVELIKGLIFKMGAPSSSHQRISMRLGTALSNYLRGRQCEVFSAPFDVRLPRKSKNDNEIPNVFQPDLCVICDPSKIDERGCLGAPDIVVEILSPANNKKELKYKYEVYEEAGVKEYWIVDPREKAVLIYLQINGKLLASGALYAEDKVASDLLPGFSLDIGALFEQI